MGNLDPRVSEADLWGLFDNVVKAEGCKLIKDRTGKNSYGFVDFHCREDAEAALHAINGTTFSGNELKVNWASHSSRKDDSSGEDLFSCLLLLPYSNWRV